MKNSTKNILITDFIPKIVILIFITTLVIPSCNTTKFLKDDELLLNQQDIKIIAADKKTNASDLKSELQQFYKQVPNRNLLFIPREWYWFRNQDPGDTTWLKKWHKNSLGEEPAILDERLQEQTRSGMQNYLRNKKGFYNARVESEMKTNGKLASIEYRVKPGSQYTINSLQYISKDSSLTDLIEDISRESLLEPGDPVESLNFDLEAQRISSELQNLGYANFNRNYIDIKGDSSDLAHGIDIFFEILPYQDNQAHKKFRVGDLKVYTDYHQFQKEENIKSETLFGNAYLRESNKFIVKPSIINQKIYLLNNEVYRADNYRKTLRKLFSLDSYRFVKINQQINPLSDTLIDYSIFMTPQNKKWIFDLGTDIFFSNISRVDENLIGFAVGTGLTNRNTFGGSERYKVSVETGVEFKAGTPIESNTFSLGVNNSLDIPKVTKPLNLILLMNKIGIIKDKSMNVLKEEGKTTIGLGYNFLDILDYYKISSLNTSYGYDFRPSNKNRLVFNQIGFNLTQYTVRPQFDTILLANPLQKRRFETVFFSGLIFKDLLYYYQSDNGANRSNFAFISNLELSGLEVFLANKAYNAFSGNNDTWKLANEIDFEKFVKLSLDGRWNRRIYRESNLAARLKAGIAIPFGEQNGVVSFIKQLLVGGPNSIRAWRPMQLGPGNFIYTTDDEDPIYFQRGDLSLEFSLEYRFNLFWLLEGALFFDAGNIWTLKEDAERPGAKITPDFYKQIAMGYGYGLRWDFSYFIIRFDFGFKLRNPYPLPDNNSQWVPFKGQGIFGNANVAINYPF